MQKVFKKVIDSVEQEIILNNINPKNLEDWRKFEAQVIAEKNIVESVMGMLSGLNTNPNVGFSYTRIPDPPSFSHKFSENTHSQNSINH